MEIQKVQDVIEKALSDRVFANELKLKAKDLSDLRAGSPEWKSFLELFAQDEKELSWLCAPQPPNCTVPTRTKVVALMLRDGVTKYVP